MSSMFPKFFHEEAARLPEKLKKPEAYYDKLPEKLKKPEAYYDKLPEKITKEDMRRRKLAKEQDNYDWLPEKITKEDMRRRKLAKEQNNSSQTQTTLRDERGVVERGLELENPCRRRRIF